MVTTTRRAAWRSGPANGWHDDLVWYAAAIHQMRARTPELDDFLQIYRDFEAGQIPGQEAGPQLVAIASQWGDPRGLGYQSQVHGTFVDKPDWPAGAGALAGVRAQPLVLPAVAPRLPAGVRGRGARAHRGARRPRRLGPARTGTTPTSPPTRSASPCRCRCRGDTLPAGVTVPGVEPRPDGTFPNPLFNPTRQGPDAGERPPSWATATSGAAAPALRQPAGHRARSRSAAGCWRTRTTRRCSTTRPTRSASSTSSRTARRTCEVGGTMAQFETAGARPRLLDAPLQRRPALGDLRPRPGARLPVRERGRGRHAPRSSRGSTRSSASAAPTAPRSTWTAPDLLDIDDPRLRLRHHGAAAAAAAARDRPARLRGRPVRARRRPRPSRWPRRGP